MLSPSIAKADLHGVSHNLLGQKLGRKGLETRERILKAALRQLELAPEATVTLTSVAREASVGMTTLYLYFPDLGSLVLATLKRVMDSADVAFVDRLRVRWGDDVLEGACLDFLKAHHRFWREHARILHMRNSFADASDGRFLHYRAEVSRPLIELLMRQMGGSPNEWETPRADLATVLLTSFERLATVVTNPNYSATTHLGSAVNEVRQIERLVEAEAVLLALGVRHGRALGVRRAQSLIAATELQPSLA